MNQVCPLLTILAEIKVMSHHVRVGTLETKIEVGLGFAVFVYSYLGRKEPRQKLSLAVQGFFLLDAFWIGFGNRI
jgi:hypothetical protein